MEINLIPQVPNLRFNINNTSIGMVNAMREAIVSEPIIIRSVGKSLPVSILQGPSHYELSLTRLLLDTSLIPSPLQLYNLHSFTIDIICETKTISFEGCEFSRLEFSSDMEQGLVEKASILALKRTESSNL